MIEVNGLVKRYGARTAVDGVSFRVGEGEVFGLLGPNGAGKTTTISILSGLLPPDGGETSIAGYDLAREANRIKPLIGLVPQELALYPTLGAYDNLAFFGRVYGLRGKVLERRIAEVLELAGLRERAREAVETFSGGMKRRLNIAVGLVHSPRILFLDEPTVGVDPQSRNFIFDHVEKLKSEGMTIIYTTHYMEEAERLCDRVAIIDEGRVLALDTTRALVGLLGGGVIRVGMAAESVEAMLPLMRALPGVSAVSSVNFNRGETVADGRLKIETGEARSALLEVIQLCNARDASVLSLEVLEPNLESVFLHLTGKRLRD